MLLQGDHQTHWIQRQGKLLHIIHKYGIINIIFLSRRRDCLEDSDNNGCSLNLFPEENSWHYLTVTPTRSDRMVSFAINVKITGEVKHNYVEIKEKT